MPPKASARTGKEATLTEEDLASMRASLAQNKRVTVYLREATPGLGLPAGASGRVVRIDGRTVVLRPRGIDDELPFEAEELRATKQARPAPVATPAPAAAPASRKPRPAPATRAGVTITISGDESGEWTVAVTQGARAKGRPSVVPAEAVQRAVEALDDSAARTAVDGALRGARKAAAERVEQLSRQLSDARDALAALGPELRNDDQ